MEVFIFGLCSLVILIPLIYILPLGFSKKGKHIIVITTIFIASLSLLANMTLGWWQSVAVLFVLVIATVYFIHHKFAEMMYEESSKSHVENGETFLRPEVDEQSSKKATRTIVHHQSDDEQEATVHKEKANEQIDELVFLTNKNNAQTTRKEEVAPIHTNDDLREIEAEELMDDQMTDESMEFIEQMDDDKRVDDENEYKLVSDDLLEINGDNDSFEQLAVEKYLSEDSTEIGQLDFLFEQLNDENDTSTHDEFQTNDASDLQIDDQLQEDDDPSTPQVDSLENSKQQTIFEDPMTYENDYLSEIEQMMQMGNSEAEGSANETELTVEPTIYVSTEESDVQPHTKRQQLQQAMVDSVLEQIVASKEKVSKHEYEQMMIDCLQKDLSDVQYYTFARLLILHYLEEKDAEKLTPLLGELEIRFHKYPIIIGEIDYIKTLIVK